MGRLFKAVAAIIAISFGTASAKEAETPAMTYTFCTGQAEIGHIERFHWKVLEAVLERTRKAYGDYRLVSVPPMPISRQEYELTHEDPIITIAAFDSTAERRRKLLPVRIPVDRGLLGYRVLLIREGDQARFDQIRTLEDLKSIQFGLMPTWSDRRIMQAAGLNVVDGDSYDGLYRMLAAKRFDAFSRGITEVIKDFERSKSISPGLAIERHMLLHYPMPVYFWFADDRDGRRRAERVREGLGGMVADGSLAAMIRERYRADLADLDIAGRRVVDVPNPLLDGQDPLDDDRLWFRPQ